MLWVSIILIVLIIVFIVFSMSLLAQIRYLFFQVNKLSEEIKRINTYITNRDIDDGK
jgi:hypothetical protein